MLITSSLSVLQKFESKGGVVAESSAPLLRSPAMTHLNRDCLVQIFSFLPIGDLVACSMVSHAWNDAAGDITLWTNVRPKMYLLPWL
jgi:hypothetical protein